MAGSPSIVISTSPVTSGETLRSVGARLVKMVISLHSYITNPADGPGDLTTSTHNELAKIVDHRKVQLLVGTTLLELDLEAAFLEFAAHHPIFGDSQWSMFEDMYKNSKADKNPNPNPPHSEEELAEIAPGGGPDSSARVTLRLDYGRLEFLGDAVLEVASIKAWIEKGSVEDAFQKTGPSACNRTLQTVCVAAGLQDYLKGCDKNQKRNIQKIKADYTSNKQDWDQGLRFKILGDVMESIYGAVSLDSGLKLSAVEGVSKKIH
ncbi:hypothetical protein BGX34_010272 [Mortierella sp. NVP85]|nr:hypothetical protein BGX34_010272 [Mortierella sp. NVP85]